MNQYISFVTRAFEIDPYAEAERLVRESGDAAMIAALKNGQWYLGCTSASPDLETRSWLWETAASRESSN